MDKNQQQQDGASDNERIVLGGNQPPEPIGLATADELPARLKEQIAGLIGEFRPLHEMFGRMPARIEDDDVYQRATTLGARIKDALDKIEKARKKEKDPYTKAGTKVDQLFKLDVVPAEGEEGEAFQLCAVLKTAMDEVKARLSDYDTRKYEEEEQRRSEEATRLAEAAAADGITIDPEAAGSGAAMVSSTRSQHGGLAVRNIVKEWEIVDATLVPANLCSPDPVKIQAMIDAGATEIPGVKINKKVSTHVKRR